VRTLRGEYFACVTKHGVPPAFNSGDALPPVSEPLAWPGSVMNPILPASRFRLKPGRKDEAAVKSFPPSNETKEINEEARKTWPNSPDWH
jgi:hypothetical protein